MTTARTPDSRFVRTIRGAMAAQNMSVRGLARRIDPQNVERARRNIYRWLDEGIVPNRSSRRELAAALGIDEQSLDDEEDEPALPSYTELIEALRPLGLLFGRDVVRS